MMTQNLNTTFKIGQTMKGNNITRLLITLGLAFTTVEPIFAQEEQKSMAPKNCRERRGSFHFQFEEANIFDVLKQVSYLTCKNFILSDSVKGKTEITIISRKPVTTNQAYSAFLSAMQANGLALIPSGRFYKVVKMDDAKNGGTPIYERDGQGGFDRMNLGEYISYDDAFVTVIYEMNYITKEQIDPVVKTMLSKNSTVDDIGNGMMLMTDSAANIRRLLAVLDRVDVRGSSNHLHVVDILYADAGEVSTKLDEIFKETSIRTDKSDSGSEDVSIERIVADERTNKLIIISSDKAFARVREVIDMLDVPGEFTNTQTQVFVYPLNNGDAQKVAQTLSSLAQGQSAKKPSGKKAKKDLSESAKLFEGEVKITADEATNSLVITASGKDYKSLKPVIANLDQRRPQVFVEAAILEVAIDKTKNLNIDAYAPLPGFGIPGVDGDVSGFAANQGGRNLITSQATLGALDSATQNTSQSLDAASTLQLANAGVEAIGSMVGWLSLIGPTTQVLGLDIPSVGLVLNALERNGNADVLSTPHLMTVDNEEAEISIGEEVPILSGFGAGGGGGGAGGVFGGFGNRVEYKDVKLKFKVTPHVNDADEVRLEIEQEVSNLGPPAEIAPGIVQPTIRSKDLKTSVIVSDQQTTVLGGLIGMSRNETISKFPGLGDIPILGWLFKSKQWEERKTNLLLVLTPYIVRNENDFKKIYERKMKERQDFIDMYYGNAHRYNPYVDYSKKNGPLQAVMRKVEYEMMKIENGGDGLPGEQLITPEMTIQPFADGLSDTVTEGETDDSQLTPESNTEGSAQ